MKLTYYIISYVVGSINVDPSDASKYCSNVTINVGIEGDTFGLVCGDGCTVSWDQMIPYKEVINNLIPEEINKYINEKYNGK